MPAAQVQGVKPAFEVHKLDGFVMESFYKFDKGERDAGRPGLIRYEKKVPAGYMVYFPQGHSIRVGSEDELRRLGLSDTPYRVDMDSGEVVPVETLSLKDQNAIHNKQSRLVNLVPSDETEDVKENDNG